MASQGPHVLLLAAALCLLRLHYVEGATELSAPSPFDAYFCHGGLEVHYPEVDVTKCLTISHKFREKISKVWNAPHISFPGADKKKKYVLMMVDPDAPSPKNPTRAHWRHWLVVDIKGSALGSRELKGKTLSEYVRPTPPSKSAFHRYQFALLEQPADKSPSLSEEERSSLGNWDPQAFIERFHLGAPVASVQFVTQNHRD